MRCEPLRQLTVWTLIGSLVVAGVRVGLRALVGATVQLPYPVLATGVRFTRVLTGFDRFAGGSVVVGGGQLRRCHRLTPSK